MGEIDSDHEEEDDEPDDADGGAVDGSRLESNASEFELTGRLYIADDMVKGHMLLYIKLFPYEQLKSVRYDESEFAMDLFIPAPIDEVIRGAFNQSAGQVAFQDRTTQLVILPTHGKFDLSVHPKQAWLSRFGDARRPDDKDDYSWATVKLYYKPMSVDVNVSFADDASELESSQECHN